MRSHSPRRMWVAALVCLTSLGACSNQNSPMGLSKATTDARVGIDGSDLSRSARIARVLLGAGAGGVIPAGGRGGSVAVTACLENMRNWFSSVYWFHHESGRYMVDSWDDRSTPPYVNNEAAGGK